MDFYSLFFKSSAEKELRGISKPHLEKIIQKIGTLSQNPRPHGVQILKGDARYYRVRQGDYRIICEIDDRAKKVILIKIGHRREVYE